MNSGLLAISPDRAASVYEYISSAVLVGAGRTGEITVNAASRRSVPLAAQMLEATAAERLSWHTLVMVDPGRASVAGATALAGLGVASPSGSPVEARGRTEVSAGDPGSRHMEQRRVCIWIAASRTGGLRDPRVHVQLWKD